MRKPVTAPTIKAVGSSEAAKRLGVSIRTVYNWTCQGRIRAMKTWRGRNAYTTDEIARVIRTMGGLRTRRQ